MRVANARPVARAKLVDLSSSSALRTLLGTVLVNIVVQVATNEVDDGWQKSGSAATSCR